ncbi:hypothetical protein FJY69_07640 [candidate division WOR-3 bacterium]|nr:hypothetical protein [candidate division WOR-3 bacterium]
MAPRYQVVLLLGGVLVTMLVRAVEGQGTRDPVSHPSPSPADSAYASGARTPGGAPVTAAPERRPGASVSPRATAGYVSPIPAGSETYAMIEAELARRLRPGYDDISDADSSEYAWLVRDFVRVPRRWGQVMLPTDIREALGDAQVYVGTGGANWKEMWAMRGDEFYFMPDELNQFVVDGRLLPDTTNVALTMRVYQFFLAAAWRLRLDYSFAEDRFAGVPPRRVDSMVGGLLPLVPAFSVRVLEVEMGTDSGPGSTPDTTHRPIRFARDVTPLGTVHYARAVIDWGDRQDTAFVRYSPVVGAPGRSFPERWRWGAGSDDRTYDIGLPSLTQ